jgi:glutamate synthase domain-containing protein 1
LEPQLGDMLTDMLITMTDRGPDSAGIAIYGGETTGNAKLTLQSDTPDADFDKLDNKLRKRLNGKVKMHVKDTHAVIEMKADQLEEARRIIAKIRPNVRMMSRGESLEIYKEVGLPKDVAARFDVRGMSGSHGIGHTRMATESAVTTMGAHPFNTGMDQCLVHNAVQPQLSASQSAPPWCAYRNRKRHRSWCRLSDMEDARGLDTWRGFAKQSG